MPSKIFFFGDSITEGQFVGAPNRWFDIVSQKIYESIDIEYFMGAVSGDTSTMGLARFPKQVQQIKPDWLFIQFGFNDSNRWKSDLGLPRVSKELFKASIMEMINRARYFGVKQITLINNYKCLKVVEKDLFLNNLVSDYNQSLKDISIHENTLFIDLFKKSQNWDLKVDLLPDGLHLSKKGHLKIAEIISNHIISNYS